MPLAAVVLLLVVGFGAFLDVDVVARDTEDRERLEDRVEVGSVPR